MQGYENQGCVYVCDLTSPSNVRLCNGDMKLSSGLGLYQLPACYTLKMLVSLLWHDGVDCTAQQQREDSTEVLPKFFP